MRREVDTTGPPRRDRATPYTAESLLAVAVEVFNRRGYDGTSMEDLAQASGITKSSIYHHVRGKEELLRLGVSRAVDRLFAMLEEPQARNGRAVDRLEHVLRRTVEVLTCELPYVTLLLRVHGNTATEQWALQRRREFDRRVAAIDVGPGRAVVRMRVTEEMLNGVGSLHGGLLFTLADSAFGYACNSHGVTTVARSAEIVFVAPAHCGDVLVAVAEERLRHGRNGVYDVTVRRAGGGIVAEFRGQSRSLSSRLVRDGGAGGTSDRPSSESRRREGLVRGNQLA